MITDPQSSNFDPEVQAEIQRQVSCIRDSDHLQLLMVGYYILGAMAILYGLIGLTYVGMGIVFAHAPAMFQPAPASGHPNNPSDQFDPLFFSLFMGIFGGVFLLGGWTLGALYILTATFISRRIHRTFVMVMAGIACVWIPWGTAIGVCTFMVLSRQSVSALFANGKAAPAPAPSASNV